ncbi:deoxyribodipyrimidine photolyase [Bremerella volcania]|uniref:Deoxyribodipyrimidine photo-lyase n=1 Tax=Bremerella volcania TaxID=2527984 RepID=A0A518C7V1_9BACT|nr:deoxyribodipyrimidine photolyase [Bremerella volcania]QDU75294.1 deoxyribodipyrimidine photolyase [Bremerella volcania]
MSAELWQLRISDINDAPVNEEGKYVLYWMIANRRTEYNFSLQRAAWWADKLKKPLIVFEALRVGYQWASDRLHTFVLRGMLDNLNALSDGPVVYYPYVEPKKDAAKGLLKALGKEACVVVTDDFPCFFLPRMVKAVGKKLDVKLEAIDSNGLLPMRAADRDFPRAYSLRRFLQKELPPHLEVVPNANPLAKKSFPATNHKLIANVIQKWPSIDKRTLESPADFISSLPIDHEVGPVDTCGGSVAARKQMKWFLKEGLPRYAEQRNDVESECVSQLSPYLHFGHLSVHEVFHELTQQEKWEPSQLSKKVTGSREGWWNMSSNAESFLDEIITWRELGYNMCHLREDYDQYSSLPDWAQQTLADHKDDKREHVYTLEQFEKAQTHDELWNAAQRQLVRDGRIHNYLRMLWGKKVLHWTNTPEYAAQILIHLNNKYALDGRNPNSYSGIFWCLGRYDRAWGPEREIFGKIRYMTSDSAMRKLNLKGYMKEYSGAKLFD